MLCLHLTKRTTKKGQKKRTKKKFWSVNVGKSQYIGYSNMLLWLMEIVIFRNINANWHYIFDTHLKLRGSKEIVLKLYRTQIQGVRIDPNKWRRWANFHIWMHSGVLLYIAYVACAHLLIFIKLIRSNCLLIFSIQIQIINENILFQSPKHLTWIENNCLPRLGYWKLVQATPSN